MEYQTGVDIYVYNRLVRSWERQYNDKNQFKGKVRKKVAKTKTNAESSDLSTTNSINK